VNLPVKCSPSGPRVTAVGDTQAVDLSRRDVDFGKAAGRGCLNSFYDMLDVETKSRPLLLTQYHNCDLAAGKILLVANVLVRGQ
jgi:hypothetical protein